MWKLMIRGLAVPKLAYGAVANLRDGKRRWSWLP
jgi:hypothetical protein